MNAGPSAVNLFRALQTCSNGLQWPAVLLGAAVTLQRLDRERALRLNGRQETLPENRNLRFVFPAATAKISMRTHEFAWPQERIDRIDWCGVAPDEVEEACLGPALVQRAASADF